MKTGEAHSSLFNEAGCLMLKAIQGYLGNEFSMDERMAVERHLAACPLCRDAVEGFRLIPDAGVQEEIVGDLKQKLAAELLGKKDDYKVAASSIVMQEPAPYGGENTLGSPVMQRRRIPAWALYAAAVSVLLLAGYFAFFFPKPSRPLISKNEQEQILSPGGPVSALPEKDTTQPILAAAERKTEVIRPKATQASQEKRIVGEVKGIKTEAAANQQDVAVAGIQTKALITMDTVVISFDEAIAIEQPPEISKAAEETEMEKKEDVSRSKAAGVPVATKAQVADFLIVSKDSIPVFNQPGYRDFNDYITRNLTYPARARRQGVEGTVLVRFCVDIHGKIKDVTVIRSAGSLLDDEARRVVEKSPPWIPAYKNEQPVETIMTCPVMFLLHQP